MPSASNIGPAAFNGWTGQAKKGGADKPPGAGRSRRAIATISRFPALRSPR